MSPQRTRAGGIKIALIVEGDTERAFLPHLRSYLARHLAQNMPNLRPVRGVNGRIPKREELNRLVANLLESGFDFVIAITDVYTGCQPVDFIDAADAKNKMREWAGNEDRFIPHAAQYEFEAWLLPYWSTLQKLAKHAKSAPTGNPERVNHNNPPSKRIKELFEIGKRPRSYSKTRDASRVLQDNDLAIAIDQCSELKSFINTILTISGATPIP